MVGVFLEHGNNFGLIPYLMPSMTDKDDSCIELLGDSLVLSSEPCLLPDEGVIAP